MAKKTSVASKKARATTKSATQKKVAEKKSDTDSPSLVAPAAVAAAEAPAVASVDTPETQEKPLFQIKSWITGGGVLFELRCDSLKICFETAVRSGADLSRADLSGANLSGANLSGADLSRAYLSGAYLSGADLSDADLSRAYLSGAYLSGADLSGANLSGANLSGAYLSGANLSGAYLSGANLSGANLSGAYLSGANLSIGIKVSWNSHTLLAEILRRAAGPDVAHRQAAGLIAVSFDWCWDKFLSLNLPEMPWALQELSKWVTPDDGAPECVASLAAERLAAEASTATAAGKE